MSQAVAKRYAQALFEVAKANDSVEQTQEQLTFIARTIGQHEALKEILRHPKISIEQKKGLLQTVFADVWSRTVQNFIELLIDKGRESELSRISEVYQALGNQEKGIVRAYVTTAKPLTDEEKANLVKGFGEKLGKTLEIESQVDPEIIGGLTVRIGNRLYDGSLKGKLSRFQQQLTTQVR
jgi:F-type H+-transporting ATPase subunit delta